MAAPIGNTYAVGFGRPRSIDRELGRLRAAAAHVDKLLQHHAVIDLLGRHETPFPSRLLYAKQVLAREIRDVEEAAAMVEAIVAEDGSAPRLKGRRKRRKGRDLEQAWMTQGAVLDRLIDHLEGLPQ